jgi:drug/metabolite transporter (DMT)-like permease
MNPVLLGSIAALCWGTLDFLAGTTSRAIGPIRVTAAVTVIGLIFLSLWLWTFGEFPPFQHDKIWWPLLAGIGYAFATLFLFAGIASGPVSLVVPISMSYPATSVMLAMLVGDRPSLLQLLFVALILAGVLLVALGERDNDEPAVPGRRWRTLMFAILAHLTFVGTVFAGQTSAAVFGEIEATWISRLAGAAVVLPLLPLSKGGGGEGFVRFLPLLSTMALLDTVAAALIFAAGKSSQPELATVCASASGAITVVLAWIFLREKIVYLRWLGIAATFFGIAALSALK